MERLRLVVLSFILFLLGVLPAQAEQDVPPPPMPGDWSIPGGRFFPQTAPDGYGFSVVDDSQARFWSEYQRLGGAETVGYPISQRFIYDGFVTQAFQKLVLQWRPEVGQAWPMNIFDELSKADRDEALFAYRQIPRPLRSAEIDPPGASWMTIVRTRQGLLNGNAAIRVRYFSVADPLNVFGLPTSRVEDMGSHYAIRTQRAVFQQWKENVPWARARQVTIANGGDIGKDHGWLPAEALRPEPEPQEGNLPGWNVRTLLVGPGTPGRLYALQFDSSAGLLSRLMVSGDLGDNWAPFQGGLPVSDRCMHNIAMDYATANGLYASTCQGIFRWSRIGWEKISSQETFRLAIPFGKPETIWAVTHPGPHRAPIIRSDDGGKSWNGASTGLSFYGDSPGILDLAVDPRDETLLYTLAVTKDSASGNSLQRGTGSGQWSPLPREVPFGISFALDGATGHLYITSIWGSELWRSPNPAESDAARVRWEKVHVFAGSHATLLATGWSPDGLALYVNLRETPSSSPVPYRSLDGGRSWEMMRIP